MHIDFAPVKSKEIKYADLAAQVTRDDLRIASDESIDYMLSLIADLDDAAIVFEPVDDSANDPYATDGEEGIAWNVAHLIAHVTASSEEGAAFSSVLARGFAQSERPRFETPWRDITTKAQCVQRLEESRRIRNAYLDTWPDQPHLDVFRAGMSERFEAATGGLNAIGCFLLGLGHEVGHHAQIVDAITQATAA